MKKIFVFLSVLFISLCSKAQESGCITTSFELPKDEFVLYLTRAMNVGLIKTVVSGESLKGASYDIERVTCHDGKFEKRNLTGMFSVPNPSDTLTFYFISRPLTENTVSLQFFGTTMTHNEEEEIDTANSLLIEPKNPKGYNPGENIPIMAYSPGITTKFEINGEVFEGMDICGVRDSGIDPAEWYDKLGISDYVYFQLVPKGGE